MLRHIKPGMLVFSVLYILLGLLLLLAPQAVADVFCIALGLLVVLCGLQSLYGYFKKDNGSIRAAVSLLLSLPTIALGMWALLCTVQSAMTFEWLLPLLFGLSCWWMAWCAHSLPLPLPSARGKSGGWCCCSALFRCCAGHCWRVLSC